MTASTLSFSRRSNRRVTYPLVLAGELALHEDTLLRSHLSPVLAGKQHRAAPRPLETSEREQVPESLGTIRIPDVKCEQCGFHKPAACFEVNARS